MNKFTKLVIFSLFALSTAFTSKAEFRWGATAGASITTLKFKQELATINQGVGPTLGIQGEMMFPGIGLGIDLGAMYTMQGATLNLQDFPVWSTDGYGKERSYLHTLSIPIDLRFKWTRMNGLEDYVAPFVFGGPVFNFTVCHNSLKAMEYPLGAIGVQAGLGFEILQRWQIQGSYTWGMTYSTRAVKLIDYSAREKYWTVRAVYFF
jgi:hypothetical protein